MITRTQSAFSLPPAGQTRLTPIATLRPGDRAHLAGGVATVERVDITPAASPTPAPGPGVYSVRLLLRTGTGRALIHEGRGDETLPLYVPTQGAS